MASTSPAVFSGVTPEIGGEVHVGHDQLLYFVAGSGLATIGETETEVADGDVSIVLSGVFHNFRNTGSDLSDCPTIGHDALD